MQQSEVGYQFQGSGSLDSGGCARRNQIKSDSSLGMVQRGAQKGMEMDFSTNGSKCKGGRSATVGPSVGNGKKPLVAVSGRYFDNREGPMSSMGVPTCQSGGCWKMCRYPPFSWGTNTL